MIRPWMPLYVADYLADTAHLDSAESGAYLHLIMHYWTNEGLPADDRQLARVARMKPREWDRAKPTIKAFFSDEWKHKRIEIELAKAVDISSKRRNAAEQMLKRREANAEQMLTHSHSPSQTSEAKASEGAARKTRKSRKKPETALPDDWCPSESDLAYGRKIGLSDSEMSREVERFRNGARSKDRRLSDWGAGFRNWLLKATEFMGREAPRAPNDAAPVGFYAAAETQELDAWDRYRERTMGKSYPRDAKGGWNFPTQWPPDETKAA